MMRQHSGSYGLAALVVLGLCVAAVGAELAVLGAYHRADEPFPQFERYWKEDANLPDDPEGEQGVREVEHSELLGGSAHVFLRNDGREPLAIKDVLLDSMSLTESIAFSDQRNKRKPASIFFANLTPRVRDRLIAAGEPVWWKADPREIPPGGTGQVVVRLRHKPQADSIRLDIRHARGTSNVTIPIGQPQPRVAGIGFSPELNVVYLYFRHPAAPGRAPSSILLDGRRGLRCCRR